MVEDEDYAGRGFTEETYGDLRISGPSMRPNDVTAVLGVAPTEAGLAGQPRARNSRSGKVYAWPSSAWLLTSKGHADPASLEANIDWLLRVVEAHLPEFVSYVTRPGVEADIFIFWSSRYSWGGPGLTPEVIKRLGTAHLGLQFDICQWAEIDEEQEAD